MNDIPDETLSTILSHLPKISLKSARLTCSRWSNVGAELLFQRIYFAPHKAAMEEFTNITSNLAFVRNIKTLVYDARLFREEFCDYIEYKRELSGVTTELYQCSKGRWGYIAATLDDQSSKFETYDRLFQEQQAILAQRLDYETLLLGLARLLKVERLEITTNFLREEKTMIATEDHEWYGRKTLNVFAEVLLPSHFRPEVATETTLFQDPTYDQRGLQHLFEAMSATCNGLTDMRFGHLWTRVVRPALPVSILIKWPVSQLTSLLPRLVTLKLKLILDTQFFQNDNAVSLRVNLIFKTAQNLKSLSFAAYDDWHQGRPEGWRSLFQHQHWAALHSLDLGQADVDPKDLVVLLASHQATLKRLQLISLLLVSGDSWREVSAQLGDTLTLQTLRVGELRQWDECREEAQSLEVEKHENLARLIMGSQQVDVSVEKCMLSSLGTVYAKAVGEEVAVAE